ncbi:MAG: glutamate 5-kinase [Candidatus Adiutrix intracellularis]|jgi:glutamate 5-kinase|nr:glutamate 5-kinase [Candidatus Adiutrix intracellularis]
MIKSRKTLRYSRRIVVKVGTNILFEQETFSPNRLKILSRQTVALQGEGRKLLLVSSGAVGLGYKKMGLLQRPRTLLMKQACAAVGQALLMAAWGKALAEVGLLTAQVLISVDDLADRGRFLNARNTLQTLLAQGVVPVINENDTVAVEELKFGDNDTLGALACTLVEGDLFINLTDLDGFYEKDPRRDPTATLIDQVDRVTPGVLALAGGSGPLGAGGMYTKVRAAKRLADLGVASVIAGGCGCDVLERIIAGELVGTFFPPRVDRRLAGKKNWLAFASRPKGRLVVDFGCAQALTQRGKSLLPGGLLAVSGAFAAGATVEVVGESGSVLAIGLTNYSAVETEKIKGRHSREIMGILGYCHSDEIIHRDNLVLAEGLI